MVIYHWILIPSHVQNWKVQRQNLLLSFGSAWQRGKSKRTAALKSNSVQVKLNLFTPQITDDQYDEMDRCHSPLHLHRCCVRRYLCTDRGDGCIMTMKSDHILHSEYPDWCRLYAL